MTAALNQDFVTYAGNAISPIFTVTSNGVVVDISTVTEITWTMQLNDSGAALITKTKTAAQIVFVTNGTDGKFKVNLLGADTTGKTGFYQHYATITDSGGNQTTVSAGRMQIGKTPDWSYNASQIATVPLYQVRMLIGDVVYSDQQMIDEEITWLLTQSSNVYTAASQCARALAAKFSRMVDIVQGEMKTNYSAKARAYLAMAAQLDAQGKTRSGTMMYAGGISQSDKLDQVEDTDRVSPQFNLQMNDNLLPITPVGNQTPGTFQDAGQP